MIRNLLLLALLLFSLIVQGQNKIAFEETLSDTYVLRQTIGPVGDKNINLVTSLLNEAGASSKEGGRPSRNPEVIVKLEQQSRIETSGDNISLKAKLNKILVSGDTYVKGFDIHNVLMPTELRFRVKLLNGKNELVKEFNNQKANLKNNSNVTLFDINLPDTLKGANYKLKIEEKQLTFSDEDVKQLRERLNFIQSYYTAENKIMRALQEVVHIRPDDIDRLPMQERNLYELEGIYTSIDKQLSGYFKTGQSDPQQLSYKLRQLQEVLSDRRRALNYNFATLDQQYFNRGINLLNTGNRSAAHTYFLKSIDANPRFAPAHIELARLDFFNGYSKEASDRTRDALIHLQPDRETESRAMGLLHEIYTSYITTGNRLTNRGDHYAALSAFAGARDLCSTIGGLRCSIDALNDGEKRAAIGAFHAKVDHGKHYLSRNELQEAERAADEALSLQKEYNYLLHKEDDALNLLSQIKFQYYLLHIDTGRQLLLQKNFTSALNEFENALALEKNYTFAPVHELKQLTQKAAKPVLLAKLSDGYKQAIENLLSEARLSASTALDMQNRFNLHSDPEVQNSYSLLRERIQTQECVNTQSSYDSHFNKAKALANDKKFIAADLAYKAAINVAKLNSECSIPTILAFNGREAISAAVTYQSMLENADRFISKKRYTNAVQDYNAAREYYVSNQVNRFGLNHTSLYNFARDNRDQNFTLYVVSYLTETKDTEIAVQLLTTLLENGYAKRKTKQVQVELGKQLASKMGSDRQGDISSNILAQQYTSNHKSLKKLRKSYEKEGKRLAKLN